MTIRVNGEVIPEDAVRVEFQRLVRFYREHRPVEDLRSAAEEIIEKAKEQAIGAKLLLTEACRLNIAVPASEVDERLVRMIQQCGGEKAFVETLERQSLTRDRVRRSIENGLQVDRLVARIAEGIPEPTDEQARNYYERHREEFSIRERARVRHILIAPESGG